MPSLSISVAFSSAPSPPNAARARCISAIEIRSSMSVISTLRFKKASCCKRSSTVSNLKSVSGNTRASGLKRTQVPLRLVLIPVSSSGPSGSPEMILFLFLPVPWWEWKLILYTRLLRYTSTVSHSESALVTDAPTPCKPPENS